jgi:DNA polymerase III epsilon subunit-like protein
VRERRAIVGFNINRFDLPFLLRRSWHHGVKPPDGIFTTRGYPNPELFVDLAVEWACGDRQEFIKLDTLAKFLGVGAKNGEGKDSAMLWATERKLAVAYLKNDLELAARIMERLLGISEISVPSSSAGPQSPPTGRGEANAAPLAAVPTVPAGTIDDY